MRANHNTKTDTFCPEDRSAAVIQYIVFVFRPWSRVVMCSCWIALEGWKGEIMIDEYCKGWAYFSTVPYRAVFMRKKEQQKKQRKNPKFSRNFVV